MDFLPYVKIYLTSPPMLNLVKQRKGVARFSDLSLLYAENQADIIRSRKSMELLANYKSDQRFSPSHLD